jgi:hypothetical protein
MGAMAIYAGKPTTFLMIIYGQNEGKKHRWVSQA